MRLKMNNALSEASDLTPRMRLDSFVGGQIQQKTVWEKPPLSHRNDKIFYTRSFIDGFEARPHPIFPTSCVIKTPWMAEAILDDTDEPAVWVWQKTIPWSVSFYVSRKLKLKFGSKGELEVLDVCPNSHYSIYTFFLPGTETWFTKGLVKQGFS